MPQEIIPHPPSTNIAEITYDTDSQTLTVYFQKGGIIQWFEVDETTAHGFESALSATKYLNAYVENLFPQQRVG